MTENPETGLDNGLLVSGLVIGLVIGGVAALLRAPRSGTTLRQQLAQSGDALRGKLESAIVTDPLAESISEGKAAARRRRLELGFKD